MLQRIIKSFLFYSVDLLFVPRCLPDKMDITKKCKILSIIKHCYLNGIDFEILQRARATNHEMSYMNIYAARDYFLRYFSK